MVLGTTSINEICVHKEKSDFPQEQVKQICIVA